MSLALFLNVEMGCGIDRQYRRVCGRIIGYPVGSPDGFRQYHGMPINLNQGYMDGISITYGKPRQYIWSSVAGLYETHSAVTNCPCSPAPGMAVAPELISSNYYCESGYPNGSSPVPLEIFKNDPPWDGEQCEGTKSPPPWFSVP